MRRKGKYGVISVISALALIAVIILFFKGVRRSTHITLGTENTDTGEYSDILNNQIAVTPETVQAILKTLHRPDAYERTVSVSYYWGDGESGTVEATVFALSGYSRVDTKTPGNPVRHYISDGKTCYVWYGTERRVKEYPVETVGADSEQSIPTYEDILLLPVEDITETGYELYGEEPCLYVKTRVDEHDLLCYYVSVSDGLLTAAEQYEGDTLVYEMKASRSDKLPTASDFSLPNGKRLITE